MPFISPFTEKVFKKEKQRQSNSAKTFSLHISILQFHDYHRRSIEFDDQEILIDFKPAPVSPDARVLLNRISQSTRRFLPLQKTFSDGEIRVERRELIGEASEPSYPHTCIRNHQDSWGRTIRAPVQFSSTPEELSLLRVASPQEDHPEEVKYRSSIPNTIDHWDFLWQPRVDSFIPFFRFIPSRRILLYRTVIVESRRG